MNMFETLGKAWRIPDIRRKILFTLLMLVIFRLGASIPVPGIDRTVLSQAFSGQGLFDLFNLFSGGAFKNFTIFALSITPYVTASIIINLLTIAIPYLEQLAKEGMEGRKKMTQITRYLTVALALLQAVGFTFGFFRNAITDNSVFTKIMIILCLTAGTAFLMWLG
ncbi:MAG: preprotein translocase subunit SecY, partial [Clostridiales bacterium]|nr:preprotein translocase subunit SecY [Clostridiales bacterium]